jgi:hypothetical protein
MKIIEIYFDGILIKGMTYSKDSEFETVDLGDGYLRFIVDKKTIAHIPINHLIIFSSK